MLIFNKLSVCPKTDYPNVFLPYGIRLNKLSVCPKLVLHRSQYSAQDGHVGNKGCNPVKTDYPKVLLHYSFVYI